MCVYLVNASIKGAVVAVSIPKCLRANHLAQKQICQVIPLDSTPLACLPLTNACVCVFWLGTHVSSKSATLIQRREREIHGRRRPILRVVRLINGLLREFAIYYLAATAAASQPASEHTIESIASKR